jgi:CheY-like chemotaxis protein
MVRKNSVKILLADDDVIDRELFLEGMSGIDIPHSVDQVSNGQEVLDYLNNCKHHYPDFIFLDLNMPIMDGREVLTQLKSSEKFKIIPIFILSTSSAHHDVVASYKAGANLFLVKPSEFDLLSSTLKNIVQLFYKSIAVAPVED